jgi:hypothetical protein
VSSGLGDRVAPGQILWEPPPDARERFEIGLYLEWLRAERGLDFAGYEELWRWSVTDLEGSWSSIWDSDELLLFVALREGVELDDELRRIADALCTALSPRHVPDAIVAVPAIPRTLTGKKLELPVKRILAGVPAGDVVSPDALVEPASIDPFVAYARTRR